MNNNEQSRAYCTECENMTSFDDSGYCKGCGNHFDNVGEIAPNIEENEG